MTTAAGNLALSLFLILSPSSAKKEPSDNGILHAQPDYEITINYKQDEGAVSPYIMGFNVEYQVESDELWKHGNGPVPAMVNQLNPRLYRWPGGTLTTFYHWKRGTMQPFLNKGVQGYSDSWDEAYNEGKDKTDAEFMNLNEYLSVKTKAGSTPLIGINMASGKRFPNRRQECRDEAAELVTYVKNNTPKNSLKYYYLDNEPYMHDANYTYTPEEYADEINYYVPALKAADPDIKIIANCKNEPNKPVWVPAVIERAGANIDFIDIHYYWQWNALDFEKWTNEAVMLNQSSRPYSAERAALRAIAASKGHPHIDLAALEWNLGRNIKEGSAAPSEAQTALMVSEQFMQFVQSGVPMACFWPIHWPGNPRWNRALLDATQKHSPNKVYDMFALFKDIAHTMKVTSSVSAASSGDKDRIRVLPMKSAADGKMYIFIINKDQNRDSAVLNISIPEFVFTAQSAAGFDSTDKGHGSLNIYPLPVTTIGNKRLRLIMPKNSFAKITLEE